MKEIAVNFDLAIPLDRSTSSTKEVSSKTKNCNDNKFTSGVIFDNDRFSDNNVTEFAFDLLLVTCLLQVAFAPPLEQLPVEVDMDLGAESSTSFPFF